MSVREEQYTVWIDSRALPKSGIARYSDILLKDIGNADPQLPMHALRWQDNFTLKNGKRISVFFAILRWLYEQLCLPFMLKKANVDLFHCTKNFGLPFLAKCRKVLTVHDVIPLELKEYRGNWFSKQFYYWNYKLSCFFADRIICISEFSKKRLLAYFPALGPKIRVIYLGASSLSEGLFSHHQPRRPYILTVGGAEPRKNVQFAAKNILSDSRFQDYDLVILGGEWHGVRLPTSITGNPRVHCPGKVSESKLVELYQNASIFVFPSYYEGFGLPVFEAAALHVPVLAANASSIPELLPRPEMLFEVGNAPDFCNKLDRILKSEALRIELLTFLQKQIQQFSWEKTVAETAAVYKELLQ